MLGVCGVYVLKMSSVSFVAGLGFLDPGGSACNLYRRTARSFDPANCGEEVGRMSAGFRALRGSWHSQG